MARAVEFKAGWVTRSFHIFPHRIPVHFLPALFKVRAGALRKASLVKHETRTGVDRLQFEPDDRIDTFLPLSCAPRLNDTFAWNEFEAAADDITTEERKQIAGICPDFRGRICPLGESFGVGQCLKDSLRGRRKINFLMNGSRQGRFFYGSFLSSVSIDAKTE